MIRVAGSARWQIVHVVQIDSFVLFSLFAFLLVVVLAQHGPHHGTHHHHLHLHLHLQHHLLLHFVTLALRAATGRPRAAGRPCRTQTATHTAQRPRPRAPTAGAAAHARHGGPTTPHVQPGHAWHFWHKGLRQNSAVWPRSTRQRERGHGQSRRCCGQSWKPGSNWRSALCNCAHAARIRHASLHHAGGFGQRARGTRLCSHCSVSITFTYCRVHFRRYCARRGSGCCLPFCCRCWC
mmetsp:Transcript_58208/g.120324  ORF Transcript_58208/g.120324 Transcript_58208/m.120324 type:complete len:237 (-) Transcript_58208:514-1224(-)